MWIVILSDIESLSEVLLELRLGLRVVDREVVVLLSELLVARCHPTRCLMRREDSVNLARDAEAGLLSFLLKGFSLVRIHRREHLNSDWTPVNTSRAVSLELLDHLCDRCQHYTVSSTRSASSVCGRRTRRGKVYVYAALVLVLTSVMGGRKLPTRRLA